VVRQEHQRQEAQEVRWMQVGRRDLVRPARPREVPGARRHSMEEGEAVEVQQPLAVQEVRVCGEAVEVGVAGQPREVRAVHPFLEGAGELEQQRRVVTARFQVVEGVEVERQEAQAQLDTYE